MVQALNLALSQEMQRDSRVLVMGEDVGRDGGVFRVTDGLLGRFGGERVIDTPLAESAILGTAMGMALAGLKRYPEALEAKLNASPLIAQSMIVGDGEKYLAALIVPDKTNLAALAGESGISEFGFDALQDHPAIKARYRQEIDLALADVAEYEKIAKFRLVPQEFSIEREEFTPSLKIRRHIIVQHYRSEIQGLFRSKSPA